MAGFYNEIKWQVECSDFNDPWHNTCLDESSKDFFDSRKDTHTQNMSTFMT